MVLGIGQQQQQVQPQYQVAQGIPVSQSDSHDNLDMQTKQLDTEIQKYFLNVDPLLNAYNCTFSGWLWVTQGYKIKVLGIEKTIRERVLQIDWTARSVNEGGSNFLWNQTLSLIHATAATSKTDRETLYNMWHTHLFTIRMTLLKTYLYPSYMCLEEVKRNNMLYDVEETSKGGIPIKQKNLCRFVTPYKRVIDRHAEKYDHYDNIEIIENPYELNPQRYGNIISMMITLFGIALKSDKGFAMEQFAQTFNTATLNRIGMPTQQQVGGLTAGLKKFGIG